jgi:long-chain acyl-CoA synthetase
MIHADPFHNYCVALIVASHHALENWASKQGISYNDISKLCRRPEAIKEVQNSLVKVCTPYVLQFIWLALILLFIFFW